jgi:mannan endo-1,6-alpha-mannosidase
MMTIYKGNQTGQIPGLLPVPQDNGYYWWEAGAMFGTMIDYWYYTGDTSYNDVTSQALLFQVGPNKDYQPPNQTLSLGNDDQGFWGMSAMLAAELNFPNPPADQPQWLALAQAVYNTQASPERHDSTCGGGMRWQIPPTNTGYDYKNAISNGIFINLGARLARYTSNDTYTKWVEPTWTWMTNVGLIDKDWNVYDGAHVGTNCTDVTPFQFSYNAGIYLLTAATMYNYTSSSSSSTISSQSELWRSRTEGLLNRTLEYFFPADPPHNGIAYEPACEGGLTCKTDMFAFKAFLIRWLATVSQLAPFTSPSILSAIATSAKAAALQCSGGETGRWCGLSWYKLAQWDGTQGVGQQMAALEAVQSVLLTFTSSDLHAPLTGNTGGTSKGDVNAGEAGIGVGPTNLDPVPLGGKVGAGVLMLLIVGSVLGMFTWMTFEGRGWAYMPLGES